MDDGSPPPTTYDDSPPPPTYDDSPPPPTYDDSPPPPTYDDSPPPPTYDDSPPPPTYDDSPPPPTYDDSPPPPTYDDSPPPPTYDDSPPPPTYDDSPPPPTYDDSPPPPTYDDSPPPPLLPIYNDSTPPPLTMYNYSSPSPPLPTMYDHSPGGLATGALFGLIVGIVAITLLVAVGVFVILKRRKRRRRQEPDPSRSRGNAPSVDSHPTATIVSNLAGKANGLGIRHEDTSPPWGNPWGNPASVYSHPNATTRWGNPPSVYSHPTATTQWGNPPSVDSHKWQGDTTPLWGNAPSVDSHPTATIGSDPAGNPFPQPSRGAPNIGVKAFAYGELERATAGFSSKNCLGKGGFGEVYKGVLDGKFVAVKRLINENSEAEFRGEVEAISGAKHKNIVSLIGYCIDGSKRMIVFEYVENKSLSHSLYEKGGDDLEWEKRVKIARGTAKGLAYLHEECPQKIIHRDVKPANILLDSNFEAKVADFGIAKLCPESATRILTDPVGTPFYVDPEYSQTFALTVKSDVYSFGVVLLELVSGRRPQKALELVKELPEALKKCNFKDIADPKLRHDYDNREMELMVTCANACLRKEAKKRPSMKEIVQKLENITSHAEL